MTSLLEGAKRLVARGSDIGARIEGLDAAARAARGRLDDAVVDDARGVVERASSRLRLSADHTVVAIAGATGSGKSSTFNALTGLDLSAVGVRRPTTSWATACVWGDEGAPELLEWLGIPARHQVTPRLDARHRSRGHRHARVSCCSTCPTTTRPRSPTTSRSTGWSSSPTCWCGCSTRRSTPTRRSTTATSRRSRRTPDVMLVVLNHIDTVPGGGPRRRWSPTYAACSTPTASATCRCFAVSARTGIGIAELQAEIVRPGGGQEVDPRPAGGRRAGRGRRGWSEAAGTGRPMTLAKARVAALDDAFADAAGVPTVVRRRREVDPDARQPGHRMAGDRVALPAQAGPAQAAPPRPRAAAASS